eukprot:scaffold4936_cov96-Isochrysis_galbana.AAC.1
MKDRCDWSRRSASDSSSSWGTRVAARTGAACDIGAGETGGAHAPLWTDAARSVGSTARIPSRGPKPAFASPSASPSAARLPDWTSARRNCTTSFLSASRSRDADSRQCCSAEISLRSACVPFASASRRAIDLERAPSVSEAAAHAVQPPIGWLPSAMDWSPGPCRLRRGSGAAPRC